jgi:pimeloyl-ACP methyl ester carboxylesterase
VLKHVTAGVLEVFYEETGPAGGTPVLLLHGFPYDARAFDEVAPILAAGGCRVIVPYLRGFGPTRFVSAGTPRSGQQAVLGRDLLALMDELAIPRAVLAGYDWGGRAACIVAALWPERVWPRLRWLMPGDRQPATPQPPEADIATGTSITTASAPRRPRAEPLGSAAALALVAELELR